MQFQINDGGRADAGYKGHTGDCVCRAICITTGKPYQEVYDALATMNALQRKSKRSHKATGKRTASKGIQTNRKWFERYMESLGFTWTPTMKVGEGCKVHLIDGEIPMKGRLIIAVSKHYFLLIIPPKFLLTLHKLLIMLLVGELSGQMQSFMLQVNKMTQEDAEKAIEAYCNQLEKSIYSTIKHITITIPPGAIVVAGSPSTQANPIPIVLNGVIT
jgi:hypothetical protein